jgi:ATP-dependent protease ClpP protease subunit
MSTNRERIRRARLQVAFARIDALKYDDGANRVIAHRRGDTLFLKLFGCIGEPGSKLNAREVTRALKANATAAFIHVDINSNGGCTKEAFAIYRALKNHPGFVVTRADEVCASAATVVLAAGNHREAFPGTRLVLHRAEITPPINARWTAAVHRERAETLKRVDNAILNAYASCAKENRRLFENEMQTESALPLGIAKSWGLISCIAGEAQWIAGRPYYHY